ncbi:Peroxiredoxin-6 [Nymphon striatum]|nr:Peroxiredoxin-6 [Nymphon striatum]
MNCLQDMLRDPLQILSATTDFFGEDLKLDQDSTLKYLRSVKKNIHSIILPDMVTLGEVFPDFEAETTHGKIKFHNWLENSWAILFSHPADYTPVCTTELSRAACLAPEFQKRGVKMIALSCDSVESHHGWIEDVKTYSDSEFPYPIIADEERKLAVQFKMLDPAERDAKGLPLTCRAVFIIGPDKKLKLSILYPATTGRNFE